MPRTFGVFLSIAAAFSCSSPQEDTDVTAIQQAVVGQCYRYNDAIMAAADAVVNSTFDDNHEHEWGIFVYQLSPECWVHGQPFMGGDGFMTEAQFEPRYRILVEAGIQPRGFVHSHNRPGTYTPGLSAADRALTTKYDLDVVAVEPGLAPSDRSAAHVKEETGEERSTRGFGGKFPDLQVREP
jgi:hypothetical protein